MRVTCLSGHNPGPYTGEGNTVYLLAGAEPALIDAATGKPAFLDDLERAIRETGGGRLARVLVTHAHPDHASGSAAIAERWPDARFFKMPWAERDTQYAVRWHPIADGDRLDAGDGLLTAMHTPGHAPDHLCFFDEQTRTLFSGDLATLKGTIVIPASYGGSLAQYLASLKRILDLAPTRLLPGHGPPIDEPAGVIGRYLEHRQRREDEILDALRTGCRTVEHIVSRVYENLSPDLLRPASESVLAHLLKLEEEGRVRRSEREWMIA